MSATGGAAEHRFEIRELDGTLAAVHGRRDLPDGTKQFHWEGPDGQRNLGGRRAATLPLYGTERLPSLPESTVIVLCEGEKAAGAVNGLGLAGVFAVGTVTGAGTAPEAAVLEPLARFARVVLWPDHDRPGEGHMARIATRLPGQGVRDIRLLAWAEAPDHGDAADFVAQGGDAAGLQALLDTAKPWPEERGPAGGGEGAATQRERSQAGRLVELAADWDLFRDPDGDAYAGVAADGRRQTWALPGAACEDALRRAYFERHQGAPTDRALKEAVGTLAARARYGGGTRPVFLRYGRDGGDLILDLGDPTGAVVRISPLSPGAGGSGWTVEPAPPVAFRRGSSAAALSTPVAGGSLESLRPFLNLSDDPAWMLTVAWLVDAGFPEGPFAPLALPGASDAGKTTTTLMLRRLLDPDAAETLTPPHDDEDFLVLARDTWCPVIDNLPRVEEWLSDALCRLSDGAAAKRRARFTNTEVITVRACRPVILNGIGDLATRGDLASRAVSLRLASLPDRGRREPAALKADFEGELPGILGALCTLRAQVLALLPGIKLDPAPRTVRLARVAVACEQALGWPPGAALDALGASAAEGAAVALEGSPFPALLEKLLADQPGDFWEGSPTELLAQLESRADDRTRNTRSWPGSAAAFGKQLDRITGPLLRQGIEVTRDPAGRRDRRLIRVNRKVWGVSTSDSADGADGKRPVSSAGLAAEAAVRSTAAVGSGSALLTAVDALPTVSGPAGGSRQEPSGAVGTDSALLTADAGAGLNSNRAVDWPREGSAVGTVGSSLLSMERKEEEEEGSDAPALPRLPGLAEPIPLPEDPDVQGAAPPRPPPELEERP